MDNYLYGIGRGASNQDQGNLQDGSGGNFQDAQQAFSAYQNFNFLGHQGQAAAAQAAATMAERHLSRAANTGGFGQFGNSGQQNEHLTGIDGIQRLSGLYGAAAAPTGGNAMGGGGIGGGGGCGSMDQMGSQLSVEAQMNKQYLENQLLLQKLQAATAGNQMGAAYASQFGGGGQQANNTNANQGLVGLGRQGAFGWGGGGDNAGLQQLQQQLNELNGMSQQNQVQNFFGGKFPDPLGSFQMNSGSAPAAIPEPEPIKKKKVKRKRKDKPKRPLSAYNLFFKDERARILDSIPKPDGTKEEEGKEASQEKTDDDGKPPLKKRKKVPHGKIGFESLAKIIGRKWAKLDPKTAEYYKKLAEEDMKRYKEEMEVFLAKEQAKAEEIKSRGHSKTTDEKDEDENLGIGN